MTRQEHKHLALLFLVAITGVVCLANYTVGTFLSGWDTLHPEFNFPLAFSRAFFGVFRPEQGVGAVAAHAHMADLPHIFLVWIFSSLFPINTLRYLYIFLCLFSGVIGMYFFLKRVVSNSLAVFIGALFYLLNLGTLQQFFVPFEMFTTQYAILPWLFLFGFDYLFVGKRKTLLFLAFTILLLAPTAFASVLWYVQMGVFFLILLTIIFIYGKSKRRMYLTRSGVMLGLVITLNLFWLLPNLYFLATHAQDVSQAFTNQLFSEEAFLYNKAFGNVFDILQMKTFYFSWSVYKGNSAFEPLLSVWKDFGSSPFIQSLYFLLAIPSIIGIIWASWRKHKLFLSFLPGLIFVVFFLLNQNGPTGFLYTLFQKIPLFEEALRFPDDKVLGLFTFFVAIFFTVGCEFLLKRVKRQLLFTITITSLLFLSMAPAFTGNFISPHMRVAIPESYMKMFGWFNTQSDTGRVATFPIQSPWGWEYYNWYNDQNPSFQGSGFLSFGIKQPLLDRDFDRWNPLNESYYRELSYALYSHNPDFFAKVLQKYNVHYILLDTSIIAPDQTTDVLSYDTIKEYLKKAHVTQKTSFSKTLTVYTVQNNSKNTDVAYANKLSEVERTSTYYYSDSIYSLLGPYQETTRPSAQTIVFPFHGLINHLSGVNAEENYQGISLTKSLSTTQHFAISSQDLGNIIWADVSLKQSDTAPSLILTPILPISSANTKPIQVDLPQISTDTMYVVVNKSNVFQVVPSSSTDTIPLGEVQLFTNKDNSISIYQPTSHLAGLPLSQKSLTASPCSQTNGNEVFGINNVTKNGFSLFSKETNLCMTIPLSDLIPKNAPDTFLLRGSYVYSGSDPSSLCLADTEKGQCLLTNFTDIEAKKIDTSSQFAFSLRSDEIENHMLKLAVDTTANSFFVTNSYHNMAFFIESPLDEETVSGKDVLSHIPSTIVATNSIKATVGQEDNTLMTLLPSRPNEGNDCIQNPLTYKLTQNSIKRINTASYSRYTATNGSYCDHISYPHIPHNQGYLLSVTARSISGLTPRICVSDPRTGRCNVYTKLAASDAFTTQFFLIPPFNDNNEGYDVNINNEGIPGTESVNDIASIALTPISYDWLEGLHSSFKQNQQSKISNMHYVSFLNKNLFLLPSVPSGNHTIILGQSFDAGWKMYRIPEIIPSSLAQWFPFFLQSEPSHSRVNGWENGWNIQNNSGGIYVIIFLPQYLEYIGFAVGIIGLTFLIIYVLRSTLSPLVLNA